MNEKNTNVSLYVVRNPSGKYFAGFNPLEGTTTFVDDAITAKKFSNKNDIRLRPEEMLVELSVDLATIPVKMSEPFRPKKKVARV